MTENTKDMFEQVIEAATAEIPEAREDAAKLYSRIRVGKTTLAYIWRSGKDATRIDLYVGAESLPKSVKVYSPGRGRARKEGLIATLTEKSPKSALNGVIEGLKVAAQFNVKTEAAPAPVATEPTPEPTVEAPEPTVEPTVEPDPKDETDADLRKAAAAADVASKRATAKRKTAPLAKRKTTAKA